jgi:hypothetical protein
MSNKTTLCIYDVCNDGKQLVWVRRALCGVALSFLFVWAIELALGRTSFNNDEEVVNGSS